MCSRISLIFVSTRQISAGLELNKYPRSSQFNETLKRLHRECDGMLSSVFASLPHGFKCYWYEFKTEEQSLWLCQVHCVRADSSFGAVELWVITVNDRLKTGYLKNPVFISYTPSWSDYVYTLRRLQEERNVFMIFFSTLIKTSQIFSFLL
jgi:hypothetical protein